MSGTTPTPVVVVTEERRRRGGLLWVAGGAALLLGGSTFALWSASDGFTGGSITAGDLNVTATADTTFWDVSADRADGTATVTGTDGSQTGHALAPADASTWRIVPGDKVAASFSADVTLEGDNLVGKVTLDGVSADALENTGMTYTYEVYKDGDLIVSESPLFDAGTPVSALMYLSAPGTGQDAGLEDAEIDVASLPVTGAVAGSGVLPMASTTEDFTVVVYGTFAASTAERDQVGAVDQLAGMTVRLEQVRDTGLQFS
jgi:alternate signal-mediated exported protein